MDYETFMKTCKEKITEGDVIYRSLAYFIAKRFKMEIPQFGELDSCVYHILNHYVEEVDEDFETWLNKDDAPLIRHRNELRKIFHEFSFIKSDSKLIETVNKVYGVELELSDRYFYSLSFDFGSFTPIDVEDVHRIKNEIEVLKKYGHPTTDLEKELESFGLSSEILEVI